jgi:hypothetical protein
VSVLLPLFDQARFVRRALASLQAQSFAGWELIVVDDGSRDGGGAVVAPCLADARVRHRRLPENRGLGAALNAALEAARAPLVAYLPADDVYHRDHLASLVACLDAHPEAALAFAGVRHHYNRVAPGAVEGFPLQLVQVVHRRTADRWVEREELVTDDLERMFWARLRAHGPFVGSGRVTCEWVDHPGQRHKLLREPLGGPNPYRARFGVAAPLRFHSSTGNRIDEVALYRRFRERPDTPRSPDGLTILLVGELAYNPERVLALEERGHRLLGLWMPEPHWYNTVGPLPFGHVEDVPRAGWRQAVRRLRPDVIYALLNWQAVPFAHHVLTENPGIPFVWHLKEGPFICLERGTWPQLVDLHRRADGVVYSSPEMRDWFATVVPDAAGPSLVLDGDLPKRDWLAGTPAPRLSERDGEPHTVVPGRPIGLHPETVAELAAERVHLHVYGDFTHAQWRGWIARARTLAGDRLHLHAHVDAARWVAEFSRYDAGWLHFFRSGNGGDLHRASWDDLNYPARLATLVAAGVPLVQRDNAGSVVATQTLVRRHGLGLLVSSMPELAARLRDAAALAPLRARVWHARPRFTFDLHADALVGFFRRVIRLARASRRGAGRRRAGSGPLSPDPAGGAGPPPPSGRCGRRAGASSPPSRAPRRSRRPPAPIARRGAPRARVPPPRRA